MPGIRRIGLMLGLAASCGPPPELETTLEQEACGYYAACEPSFGLLFGNLDDCVEAADESEIPLLGACTLDVGTAREDCRRQLRASTGTCEPIDRGACGALLSCTCEEQVLTLAELCGVAQISPSLVQSACRDASLSCAAGCLEAVGGCPQEGQFGDLLECVTSCGGGTATGT